MPENSPYIPMGVVIDVKPKHNDTKEVTCISIDETIWNRNLVRVYFDTEENITHKTINSTPTKDDTLNCYTIHFDVDRSFPVKVGSIITPDFDFEVDLALFEKAYSMIYFIAQDIPQLKQAIDHRIMFDARFTVERSKEENCEHEVRYLLNHNNEAYIALYTSLSELFETKRDDAVVTTLNFDQIYDKLLENPFLNGVVLNPKTDNIIFSAENFRAFFWIKNKEITGAHGYHLSTPEALELTRPTETSDAVETISRILKTCDFIKQAWICERVSYENILTLSIESDQAIDAYIGSLMAEFETTKIPLIDVVSFETGLGRAISEVGLGLYTDNKEESCNETWH